jgi:hypothetical protein
MLQQNLHTFLHSDPFDPATVPLIDWYMHFDMHVAASRFGYTCINSKTRTQGKAAFTSLSAANAPPLC